MYHGHNWKKVMSRMPSPYQELAEERTYITAFPASNFDNEYMNLTKYDLLEKESVRLIYSSARHWNQ